MKVMINGKIYDGKTEMIIVYLTDKDKENINNMLPHCDLYSEYPEGSDKRRILSILSDAKQEMSK